MANLKKNVAGQNMTFLMVSATTGGADAGATVSAFVTKDNGAQASGSGTVTNSGNGQYNYAPTQAETNATDVGFLFTASGDIPVNYDFHTDIVDGNGLPSVDVEDWLGHAVSVDSNNAPNVSAKYWAGTAITASSIPVATAAGTNGGLTIAGSNAATTFASGSHFIGTVDTVTTVGTLTTYTGNTVQTGDAFARLGAPAGASIAADLAEIEAETDGIAAIPTNPYTGTPPTVAQIATAVWQDATAGDFTTASSIGKSLYNAFTANSSVFTTASLVNAPTGGSAPSASAIATAVWTDLLASSDFNTASSIGALLKADINAPIGSIPTTPALAGSAPSWYTSPVGASVVLSSAGLDSVVVETGMNARQALSVACSVLAGVLAGGGTTSITIAAAGHPATNRVTATVDSSGDRSAVTLNLP